MLKRHVLVASAVIASALAVSAPAQAVTSFTGIGETDIVNGTGAFYDSLIPAGTFTDTISFDVSSDGSADVGILYLQLSQGISSLTASFNGNPISFTSAGGKLVAGGLTSAVTSGTQTLTISGVSGGSGSYSGNLSFSAVPELATWLMMIAGIGFTGAALRRRKATDYKVTYAF